MCGGKDGALGADHRNRGIYCLNPQTEFGQLRCKCPQEGCPVYLFEGTREVMLDKTTPIPKCEPNCNEGC